jgi:hypothetical protein
LVYGYQLTSSEATGAIGNVDARASVPEQIVMPYNPPTTPVTAVFAPQTGVMQEIYGASLYKASAEGGCNLYTPTVKVCGFPGADNLR